MPPLPRISGRAVVRALTRAGFVVIRIRGSHHMLRHDDGRRTVVPVHGNEDIGPGLMRKILRDVDMTVEEFLKYL